MNKEKSRLVLYVWALIFWVLLLMFLTSCAEFRRALNPDIDYQRDLLLSVSICNAKKKCSKKPYRINGFGVVPMAELYKITVKAPGKIDLLTGVTCHRQWKAIKPKTDWLNKGYTFYFKPMKGIENVKSCALELGVYERLKGRHGWALLEFKGPRERLTASIKCNGRTYNNVGVSACQAKYGLIQAISFEQDVDVEAGPGCSIQKSSNKRYYEFTMPKGDCTIYFAAWNDENKFHRLTLFGYSIQPVRALETYKDNNERVTNWSDWQNLD